MSREQLSPSTFFRRTVIQEACTWNSNNPRLDRNSLIAICEADRRTVVLDMTLEMHIPTTRAARKLRRLCAMPCQWGVHLLNDPMRTLLRTKATYMQALQSCFVEYRFFLFTDKMIYMQGRFHNLRSSKFTNNYIPLLQMQVIEVFISLLTIEEIQKGHSDLSPPY
jgi:hypothetical protein